MFWKYLKNNIFYMIIISLISSFLLSLGIFIVSRVEVDYYKSFKENVKVGDVILLDKDFSFYKDYNLKTIETGLSPNLNNPYASYDLIRTNRCISGVPIFFIDDESLQDECIIDYQTYIKNNCPESIEVLNDTYNKFQKIKVNDHIFAKSPGIFCSKNYTKSQLFSVIFYSSIFIDENNINEFYELYKENKQEKYYCFQGDLLKFYDKENKNDDYSVKISYISLLVIIYASLVSSYITYLYHKKNYDDYNLLYIMGESKKKIFFLSNSIIFLSIIISILLSFGIVNLCIAIYNLQLANLFIKFGPYSFIIMIMYVFIEFIFTSLVSCISIIRIKGV